MQYINTQIHIKHRSYLIPSMKSLVVPSSNDYMQLQIINTIIINYK